MKRFNESIPYTWKSTTVKFENDILDENEGIISVGLDTLVFKSHDTIYRFKRSASAEMDPSTIEDVIGTLAGILETNASGVVDLEFDLAKSYYERHYYAVKEDSIIWNILDEAIKWSKERSTNTVEYDEDAPEDGIVELIYDPENINQFSTVADASFNDD